MYAAEFDAKIKNGQIHVPEQFVEQFRSDVRVILLAKEPKKSQSNLIKQLLINPINVSGFHPLKRDEIYAR